MSPTDPIPADPGLLARFRAAGSQIAWRPLVEPPRPRPDLKNAPSSVRVAHLNEEEARIEEREEADGRAYLTVDSGPLGALVLLLEVDRRGAPDSLRTWEAGAIPGFPQGAVGAAWGDGAERGAAQLPLADLVKLARYALA
ncbi:MAG: hypothetical protein L3K09_03760 [Thermoplasmata archaeon]|nr:hypothetical protein [Thermoplasmata archaeon]